MKIDFQDLDVQRRYKLMTAAIVPRPVALVTSVDRDGTPNAAPYSFFNGFSDDPPLLGLGIARRNSGVKKDTGRNIEETGVFIVHLVSNAMMDGMLVTAAEFPEGVDELPLAGFSTAPGDHVAVPRITQAPIAFECRKYVTVQAGTARDIVLGEIVAMHGQDDMINAERGHIDWKGDLPIARLYGTLYAPLGTPYEGPVPDPQDLLS